jgi:hypothetical protein
MRLIGQRDLVFSARPADDGSRVVVRIGPYRFSASRGEAIALATELVAAVDQLGPQEGAGE